MKMYELREKSWASAIAPWYRLRLPAGSNPKHTICALKKRICLGS